MSLDIVDYDNLIEDEDTGIQFGANHFDKEPSDALYSVCNPEGVLISVCADNKLFSSQTHTMFTLFDWICNNMTPEQSTLLLCHTGITIVRSD